MDRIETSDIFLNLNIGIIFLCLLLATHLFCQRGFYQTSVHLLAACFMVLGMQSLFLGISLGASNSSMPLPAQPMMAVLFAPISYLLFLSVGKPKFCLKPVHIGHVIPALSVFAIMLSGYFLIFVDVIVIGTLIGYASLLTNLTLKGKQQFKLNNIDKKNINQSTLYLWLLVFTAYAWLIAIIDMFIFLEVLGGKKAIASTALQIGLVFKLTLVSFTLIFALDKSPLFDWIYFTLAPTQEPDLDPQVKRNYDKLIVNFEMLVAKHECYTLEVLSLKSMADRLGVSARLLSNAINYQYGVSYSKHMNRLRTMYAEKIINEDPSLSITTVMYESGFRTKSSFNKEFKAIVGLAPSEYRRSVTMK
jgi:AraC-like DNA-binding protein